ncbi:MAG: hypothetical protein SGILL_006366 [Bacillariaceae sp.]
MNSTTAASLEDQVAQAALCVVKANVSSEVRRQASQFLEEFTASPEAWEVYHKWLASYHRQNRDRLDCNNDQLAMQLLCLTMLQSKIRKELRRSVAERHPSVNNVRQELWEYLRQLRADDKALLNPCCLCNAAMMVRSPDGMMAEFMAKLVAGVENTAAADLPRETSLRLLACIPSEMEACQDLTNAQVTAELAAHLEVVLHSIQQGLVNNTTSTACQALKSWAETAQISLSQLNTPTCGGTQAVLPTIIQLLSAGDNNVSNNGSGGVASPTNNTQLPYDEITLQLAAQALSTSTMVISDHCSDSRNIAAGLMWSAVTQQGFIVRPLQVATQQEWTDACHSLANLIATFVTEQIDDLVSQPADMGLQVLLELQAHPHTPVALIPLEVWLTVQEIPMEDRHEHWKRPLYRRLVETLVARMAYPQSFMSWEEELELDASEFFEFRRLLSDVLSGCYFLLRVETIQMLINQVRTASHWTVSEAALYALTQISKDVTQRCKSPAAEGTIVAQDRQATCHELLGLLDQLMKVNVETTLQQNPLLLRAVVNFCGNYSPAWNTMQCPPDAIMKLLSYLQFSFNALPIDAAKATRAVCIACVAKNMPSIDDVHDSGNQNTPSIFPMVLKSVRNSMEAVLATREQEAMTTVAEGWTRLVTKIQGVEAARQALTNDLINPVLQHIGICLQNLPEDQSLVSWNTQQAEEATEALVRYLAVVQVIVRFSESPHIPQMGEWFLPQIGSCLEMVQKRTFSTPAQAQVLPKWILIHQQILRIRLPQQATTIAILSSTIPLVVQALEQTKEPATLKYVSTAVENFGGKTDEMDRSFQDLLSHLTTIVMTHPNLAEATELLQGYFDCLQRYMLYCPKALCYSPKLSEIVNLAVESISAIDAKGSTRAALIFLSQLFGWNALRLSPQTVLIMREAWRSSSALTESLLAKGQGLVRACFTGLAGGSQMLWPAYSDCLFAVVQAFVLNPLDDQADPANPSSSRLNEALLHQWLQAGMMSTLASDSADASAINTNLCNQTILILLGLARQGPKSRPKAKMLLTDFAKIRKGEMTSESLTAYTLV